MHLILLHTNDLHGHLEGHAPELDYTPLATGDDTTRGGFARIAAKVAAERTAATAAGKDVILADSGDFMMGTAFSSFIGTTEATELYEMTQMGYDAITLGNHEFDFTSAGTAATIHAAVARGATPPLVASNMTVPASAAELTQIVSAGLIPTKRVVQKGNLKIGFLGLMGKNAADVAPLAAPVTFATGAPGQSNSIAAAAQAVVDDLRNNDHVDIVIALSHSGTDQNGNGEDKVLAQNTSGIDIIVSGHTHVALAQPVSVANQGGGQTLIVQTGAYGLNVGKMAFTFTPGSGVSLDSYSLDPIDDTIQGDATVQGRVDGYVQDINNVFADGGLPLQYFTPLAHSTFDLTDDPFVETNLGDFITDAYRLSSRQPDGGVAEVAVESSGNIRQPLLKGKTGNLAFADAFNVVPLGIGPDRVPGYPLVEVYMTAQDLVNGLDFSAAASDPSNAVLGLYNNDYFLQISGVTYNYDLSRGVFDQVTHAEVGGNVIYDLSTMPTPDNTQCFRVVCTYYLASLLPLVHSAGGPVITPKQPDCATAYDSTSLPQAILHTQGGGELKNWEAFVGYLLAMPSSGGGLPEVPSAAYGAPQGRITHP